MSRRLHIVTLPGDGIGREVTVEAVKVLRAVERRLQGIRFDIEEHPAGAGCYLETGSELSRETWAACRAADAVFLGALGLPHVRRDDGTEIAPQLDLRRKLDLYAGLRPIYLFHEEHSPLKSQRRGEIDLAIVRENTEGLFASRDAGVRVGDEVAIDSLVITRRATRRAAHYACELASKRKRRVTCVDKANAFGSYAFFRRVFDEIVSEHPEVEAKHAYVDAAALFLVEQPQAFDVIVTENMFGDILSDLAAALVGGMGMAPSGDIGERHAVFQPAHGSAPDIAGKDVANPVAAVLSLQMMLEHLGTKHREPRLIDAAARVRQAVELLFAETPHTTPDLGGEMRCSEVGAALCERIGGRG